MPFYYFLFLFFLLLSSMFFSSSETAYFSVNKHRLQEEAKKSWTARIALRLLEKPDRLLSLILLGNNFVNVLFAVTVTLFFVLFSGEHLLLFSSLGTTIIILIFGEILPKSFALRYSLGIVKVGSLVLYPLQKILNPVLFLLSIFIETVHKAVGYFHKESTAESEGSFIQLRAAALEAHKILSEPYRNVLMSVLDIRNAVVEEVMIRVSEMESLDLNDPLAEILKRTAAAEENYMVVYHNNLGECLGFINTKQLSSLFRTSKPTKKMIASLIEEANYIPGSVTLLNQLEHFVEKKLNHAFVVDEYGELQGVISIHDIVGRISGRINSFLQTSSDGSLLVEGSTPLREINQELGVELNIGQATTLQGLLQERLESLPSGPVCIREKNCRIEIQLVEKGRIMKAKIVRIHDETT